MTRTPLLTLLLLAAAVPARAEDRPSEQDIFGGSEEAKPAAPKPAQPQPATPPQASPPAAAAEAEQGGARALEGEPGAERRLLGELARTDDPLQIGGLLYLRSIVGARQDASVDEWNLTAPAITDLYLDVRPSDRVRGFVLGRMFYDPTLTGSTGATIGGVAIPGSTAPENPKVVLDQLWLRFDVARTAFVTVGRQHVKWGVGRFWNPTDYLHAVRRDPLSPFDARTGTFMARVHVPWEAKGWNFYTMAIFEPLVTQTPVLDAVLGGTGTGQGSGPTAASGTAGQLGRIGAGARAEVVLGGWELGIDGVAQKGIDPRMGVDVSGGIWELDVRGEVALREGSDVPLYQGTVVAPDGGPGWSLRRPGGVRPQAVVGAEWSHKYSDDDTFTVGLEYFYNSNGYDDASLYPALLYQNAYTPFYLGRHYAGAYLVLPKPGSWDLHTFTLSLLANLSDQSGVARLDWSMTLLTYLTLEAFAQGHAGTAGGEFRFALDVPAITFPTGSGATYTSPPVRVGAAVADVGVGLRLAL